MQPNQKETADGQVEGLQGSRAHTGGDSRGALSNMNHIGDRRMANQSSTALPQADRVAASGQPDGASCEASSLNVAFYLPPGEGSGNAVCLYMKHWAAALERQGHRASFIETIDGKAVYNGKYPVEEIHFGVFLNSNFPTVKDRATSEHVRQLPIGSFPHVALLVLPYHFEVVHAAVTRAERVDAIFHFDPGGITATNGNRHRVCERFIPGHLTARPAPARPRQTKLLYAANVKGYDSLTQIFTGFPKVAQQSRKLLQALREDFSLSVPEIVSAMLGMEYTEWVKQQEWRAYAEALQKTASLFDRIATLRALSDFPCHYVLSAGRVPVEKFHPDSTFSGPIGFDRLLELYDEHGGIVSNLPSRIPNVLSERITNAMAHGVVPIVPCKGNHLEHLNGGNAFFYGEKTDSIRDAIASFLELGDESWLRMAGNAHATAMEHFSADGFAARLVAVYEKIGDASKGGKATHEFQAV